MADLLAAQQRADHLDALAQAAVAQLLARPHLAGDVLVGVLAGAERHPQPPVEHRVQGRDRLRDHRGVVPLPRGVHHPEGEVGAWPGRRRATTTRSRSGPAARSRARSGPSTSPRRTPPPRRGGRRAAARGGAPARGRRGSRRRSPVVSTGPRATPRGDPGAPPRPTCCDAAAVVEPSTRPRSRRRRRGRRPRPARVAGGVRRGHAGRAGRHPAAVRRVLRDAGRARPPGRRARRGGQVGHRRTRLQGGAGGGARGRGAVAPARAPVRPGGGLDRHRPDGARPGDAGRARRSGLGLGLHHARRGGPGARRPRPGARPRAAAAARHRRRQAASAAGLAGARSRCPTPPTSPRTC